MNHPRPNLQSHFDGIDERFLGALPPRIQNGKVLYNAPRLESAVELIPRSKWVEFKNTLKSIPILDQNGHGSCVGHASASAVMKCRAKQGMTFQLLSPCFVYALGNGGRDAGMVISDAADILRQYGICLESEFPEGNIYKSQIPDQAYETAKSRFLALDIYQCNSFDEIGTALQLGWDVVYGITVGSQFDNLDRDGVPGFGGARGGHALADAESMIIGSKGNWLIPTRNSWTRKWGLDGFCNLSEDHFSRSGYIDAYAIRVMKTDPKETDIGRPLIR